MLAMPTFSEYETMSNFEGILPHFEGTLPHFEGILKGFYLILEGDFAFLSLLLQYPYYQMADIVSIIPNGAYGRISR